MFRTILIAGLVAAAVVLSYEFVDEHRDDDLEDSVIDSPHRIAVLLVVDIGVLLWVGL